MKAYKTKHRSPLILAIFIVALTWFMPVSGHHSHGNYRMTEYTPLTGTVKELHWMNPHTWIYLEVVGEDGEINLWAMEGGSPNALIGSGWSKDSVKVGDEISVRCHRLRDGSNGCLLGMLTPVGGVEKEWD
jgi:hypothetical protein